MISNLSISTTNAESDIDFPVKIFSIYSDLIKQLQSDSKPAILSSKFACSQETATALMNSGKYSHLFDPLRVVPVNDTHSASRLYTWWIFLCFLPGEMLSSGTNRVSSYDIIYHVYAIELPLTLFAVIC